MKNKGWIPLVFTIVITLLSLCFIYYLNQEPFYTPAAIPTQASLSHFPKIIAHKSMVSEAAIGNTREAIEKALESPIEGIELDIRISKDDIPFVYHDETLEALTHGRGSPEALTWHELKAIKYKIAPAVAQAMPSKEHAIISLEEVLQVVGNQKYLFLDIKSSSLRNAKFSDAVAKLIQKYQLEESVIVESFNPFFLLSLKSQNKQIRIMYDFTIDATALGEESADQFDKIPYFLKNTFLQKQFRRILRPDILGPRWNVDEKLMQSYIARGYPVITWTVDDAQTAGKLLTMGVKGIQSNRPLYLLEQTHPGSDTLQDAGGNQSKVENIIFPQNIQEIQKAIQEASARGKKITLGGRRHSMGGQTLYNGSIHMNLIKIDHVQPDPSNQSVTVGAGASWKKVQSVLDAHGRSVGIMQSDNIFSVGGSVSVNVHGWQVKSPPLVSDILSLKIVDASGDIQLLSRTQNKELFAHVVGGYGQFGIIYEVSLSTKENKNLRSRPHFMKTEAYPRQYKSLVSENPNVALAYGRLSLDPKNLFKEAGLFIFEKAGDEKPAPMQEEKLVTLKRNIFRFSENSNIGKHFRWFSEKYFSKYFESDTLISRNTAMNADIHVIWRLTHENKDTLQEYFIPKDKFQSFIDALREATRKHGMDLLNVTIREVLQDTETLLPYAKEDMFALVLLFSQAQSPVAEAKMKAYTQELIDAALSLRGSFYLPYGRYYSSKQLLAAYPKIADWVRMKQHYDKNLMFYSDFYADISKAIQE